MSRNIAASTDTVNLGSTSKIDDLPTGGAGFSATMWFYRVGDNGAGAVFPRLLDKRNLASTEGWNLVCSNSTASVANCLLYREDHASGNKQRISSAGIISDAVWYFVALTVAAGTTASNVHIYLAAAGATPAEVSYSTTTDGSGLYNSDAADDLGVGGEIANNASLFFKGRVAEVRLYGNYILSLNEIKGIMHGNFSIPAPTLYCPLWGSMSPEPDLSATHVTTTISNTSQSGHPPQGKPL